MTTLPLGLVGEIVDFILWDTPSSMIPTAARVCLLLAELAARDDAADPIVQAGMAEAWRFLEIWTTTRH